MTILQSHQIDSASWLAKHFMRHQIAWITAEEAIHQEKKQAIALAEKAVRIGWTYADAFKNVRKRLWTKNRDYLFATKDYPSALEYIRQCYVFAGIFNLTRAVLRHGEENMRLNRLDDHGRPSAFTEDVKVGVIKFDNGSRIIAFSANPQAMAVYGGDVGLDEFAKHPNARLLWETAQGRITWGYDLAVWSSHDGEDTLFNEFAQEARACVDADPQARASCANSCASGGEAGSNEGGGSGVAAGSERSTEAQAVSEEAGQTSETLHSSLCTLHSELPHPPSSSEPVRSPGATQPPSAPWNIYFKVTMPDAIDLGLVEVINRTRGTKFTREQFLADCRSRARLEEVFEQAYMCNPSGAATNHIVDWSVIERCRMDYPIERAHLEADEVRQRFLDFNPMQQRERKQQIREFLRQTFRKTFKSKDSHRLGFDVAASGQGDLAVFYIDEVHGPELRLQALLTCRTEDWHFLQSVLYIFLSEVRSVQAAGDESGLGRQICWEARQDAPDRFLSVNFASKKSDLGFALMNQLSVAGKRFPKSEQDVASDYFALRKSFTGSKWVFSEGTNTLNPASHCDIAWAGALATHAHTERRCSAGAATISEDGTIYDSELGYYQVSR